jgi:hypothetical protein
MQFQNEDQRDEFFSLCNHDPRRVSYGSAIEHARTTNLGIFGSDADLKRDCAQIMMYEVKKWCIEQGHGNPPFIIEDVLYNEAFDEAYQSARAGPRTDVSSALLAQAELVGNKDLADTVTREMTTAAKKVRSIDPNQIYQRIFRSFQRSARPRSDED